MINNIVFSAGSLGGLSFIGSWKFLEEKLLDKNFVGFSGCSIGSIMAFLVSIGYTSEELEMLALTFKYKDLMDLQVLNVFENYGLDTGNEIERLLKELLYLKTGYRDITFKKHHIITGKVLWINASSVNTDKCYYFSHTLTPYMSVIKTIRMSISLPLIMAPVKYKGDTFIDGGFHDPCPACMFPIENTIILRIKNDNSLNNKDYGIVHYFGNIIGSIYNRLHTDINVKLNEYKIIWIHSGIGTTSFDIKKNTKRKLITIGYQQLKNKFDLLTND